MDNSFKCTCLVLNTFVNINILFVIMQLFFNPAIFVVSMCLYFANAHPFHSGSTQSFSGL